MVVRFALLFVVYSFISFPSFAQETYKPFSISGFLDAFYAFDFNRPEGPERQKGFYNHNRHNKPAINVVLIRMHYEKDSFHAVLDLQAGTYAQDNYANEPALYRALYQAYVGWKINPKTSLDIGVFESNIGWENAQNTLNPTLTRSLAAENSPYYLSGARLSWEVNSQINLVLTLNNGWQRIKRVEGNSLPGLSTQVVFSPNDALTFNWSTWIGTDDPDTDRRLRYFQNFYTQWQPNPSVKLIAGFDIGLQQTSIGSQALQSWLTPVILASWQFHEHWAIGARSEYYRDQHQVIINTGSPNGFQTQAVSFNLDRKLSTKIMGRVEGRYMHSLDPIFEAQGGLSRSNFYLTSTLSAKF